jgi:hypothetical protein
MNGKLRRRREAATGKATKTGRCIVMEPHDFRLLAGASFLVALLLANPGCEVHHYPPGHAYQQEVLRLTREVGALQGQVRGLEEANSSLRTMLTVLVLGLVIAGVGVLIALAIATQRRRLQPVLYVVESPQGRVSQWVFFDPQTGQMQPAPYPALPAGGATRVLGYGP